MNRRLVEVRPPRIAQLLLLVAFVAHLLAPVRLYSSVLLGVLVIGAGLWLMLAAWWLFKRHETAICPTDMPSSLVTKGVYRLTRNPMYLGIFVMLLGIAVTVGTLPFYVAALVWLVTMDLGFVSFEEAKLARIFGDEFDRYRARVRRWV